MLVHFLVKEACPSMLSPKTAPFKDQCHTKLRAVEHDAAIERPAAELVSLRYYSLVFNVERGDIIQSASFVDHCGPSAAADELCSVASG